jgi:transcriptional regulator with XRE-family HTH domain
MKPEFSPYLADRALQVVANSVVLEGMRFIDKAIKLGDGHGFQAKIARAAGVDPARVTGWKNGEGSPTLEQALKIARLLSVPLDYLADEETDEVPVTIACNESEKQAIIMTRANHLTPEEVVRGLTWAVTQRHLTAQSSPFGELDSRVVEGHPVPLPPGYKVPDGPRRPGRGGAASA